MSIKVPKKKHHKVIEPELHLKTSFNIKDAVISFSKIIPAPHEEYIYTGEEKMSFSERDPVYQTLFRNEFQSFSRK